MAYKNPADAAMPYLEQVPGTITPYYDPYVKSGKEALGTLQEQYNSLLNNPQQMVANWGKDYQESPWNDFNKQSGLNAINNAAAAGGFAGGTQHQFEAGNLASEFSNRGQQDFIRSLMELFGMGLHGTEGLNQQGYNAATGLAGELGQNLEAQGNLAYKGQENENKANSDFWNSLVSGGVGLLTSAIPGGSLLGKGIDAIF
jgi:hypothetical protein